MACNSIQLDGLASQGSSLGLAASPEPELDSPAPLPELGDGAAPLLPAPKVRRISVEGLFEGDVGHAIGPAVAPQVNVPQPRPAQPIRSQLGSRLIHNARRALIRASAAVLRGQAVQSKLIDHHNRRAPTLGTKLACQSFRRDRGSSSSKGFPKEDKRSGPQKKAWTPFFLLRVGFQRLSCTGRHSMRESSRSLDAAAGVVGGRFGPPEADGIIVEVFSVLLIGGSPLGVVGSGLG